MSLYKRILTIAIGDLRRCMQTSLCLSASLYLSVCVSVCVCACTPAVVSLRPSVLSPAVSEMVRKAGTNCYRLLVLTSFPSCVACSRQPCIEPKFSLRPRKQDLSCPQRMTRVSSLWCCIVMGGNLGALGDGPPQI